MEPPHLVELPAGGHELVVSIQGKVLGSEPRTGKQLWTCNGIEHSVCPSIISQRGVLYVLGGRESMTIAVYAGGLGGVTQMHRMWVAQAGANVSPVIYERHIYLVSDRSIVPYCVRLTNRKSDLSAANVWPTLCVGVTGGRKTAHRDKARCDLCWLYSLSFGSWPATVYEMIPRLTPIRLSQIGTLSCAATAIALTRTDLTRNA